MLKQQDLGESLVTGSIRQSPQAQSTCEDEINLKVPSWDFPRGPVVKNSPSNAKDASLIPGQGSKIAHAVGAMKPTCCK